MSYLYEYGQYSSGEHGVVQAMVHETKFSLADFHAMILRCKAETDEKTPAARVKKICRKMAFKYGFEVQSYDHPPTYSLRHGASIIDED